MRQKHVVTAVYRILHIPIQLSINYLFRFKQAISCPTQCGGKFYSIEPGILVRVKGQNLAAVHKYWIEKLRCALCGYLVSADVPDEVGNQKYDATFKALLALQKYYVAIPFYRQAYFQSLLGVPLPASTQWQLVEEVGGAALLVFPTLERMAANGDVIHNDDSHVKITDLIRSQSFTSQQRTNRYVYYRFYFTHQPTRYCAIL